MLLLLAEAEVEAGVAGERDERIVNEIRARAAVRAQGPGSRSRRPSPCRSMIRRSRGRRTESARTRRRLPVRPLLVRRVRYERRLELAMEGQRFFDLRRWGIAEADAQRVPQRRRQAGRRRRGDSHLAASAPFAARHALYPDPRHSDRIEQGGTGTRADAEHWLVSRHDERDITALVPARTSAVLAFPDGERLK